MTLRDRMTKNPLKLNEAIDVAIQIASRLPPHMQRESYIATSSLRMSYCARMDTLRSWISASQSSQKELMIQTVNARRVRSSSRLHLEQ